MSKFLTLLESALSEQAISFEAAKEKFGTTEDFNLGGFILPDGSVINLSSDGKKRNINHAEVADEGRSYDDLIQFLRNGAIRFDAKECTIQVFNRMTLNQERTIHRLINFLKKNTCTYGIVVQIGKHEKDSAYSEDTDAYVIIDAINSYFGEPH